MVIGIKKARKKDLKLRTVFFDKLISGGEIFMKSTGVVRKVDELGRIVLPIEIRKVLDIKQKDAVEIFTDNDKIILQKYQPACIFCNNTENVVYFNGKRVCSKCVEQLKSQF